MLRVRCPGCSKIVKAGDDWLGLVANCPGCGAQVKFSTRTVRPPELSSPTAVTSSPPKIVVDAQRPKSTSDLYMHAEGVNGQLTLLNGRIRISREGVLAFLTQGLKGEKEIQISSISSMQWKSANSFTNGYIQFAFYGGTEAKGGLFQATEDENSIMFRKSQQSAFEAIREAIQIRLNQRDLPSSSGSASAADEIRKLATLRDEGILTDEEFEAKKRQLLKI